MPDKIEFGKRIKKTREAKNMTLKNIEASASISATHISEIERGKTSPTLGALLKLAKALGKDPAFFLEEEELGDVSAVTLENRLKESMPDGTGTLERLTTCIPGGRLRASMITLAPGQSRLREPHSHDGSEAAYVMSGTIRFRVGEQVHELDEGDTIHFHSNEPHVCENASKRNDASMIWLSTDRERD